MDRASEIVNPLAIKRQELCSGLNITKALHSSQLPVVSGQLYSECGFLVPFLYLNGNQLQLACN